MVFFTFTAVFTMYFNGGMVPTYLIVKSGPAGLCGH